MQEARKKIFKNLQDHKDNKNNNGIDNYNNALQELRNGKKETHWIWYVFPQIKNLGQETTISKLCSIKNLDEAVEYLKDKTLGKRLVEATETLYNYCSKNNKQIKDVLNDIDLKKLRSSMTLFELAHCIISNDDKNDNNNTKENIFTKMLNGFFAGKRCEKTLKVADYENKTLKKIGEEIAIFMREFSQKFWVEKTNEILHKVSVYGSQQHNETEYNMTLEKYIKSIIESICNQHKFKFAKNFFDYVLMSRLIAKKLNLWEKTYNGYNQTVRKQYDEFKTEIIEQIFEYDKDRLKNFNQIYKDHRKLEVIMSSIEKAYDNMDGNKRNKTSIEKGFKKIVDKNKKHLFNLVKNFYYVLSANDVDKHSNKHLIEKGLDETYLGNINRYDEFEKDYKKIMWSNKCKNIFSTPKEKQNAFKNFKKNIRKELVLQEEETLLPEEQNIREHHYLSKLFDFLTENDFNKKISSIEKKNNLCEKDKEKYIRGNVIFQFFELTRLSNIVKHSINIEKYIVDYFFGKYLPVLNEKEINKKREMLTKNCNFLSGGVDRNVPNKVIDVGEMIEINNNVFNNKFSNEIDIVSSMITNVLPFYIIQDWDSNIKKQDNDKESTKIDDMKNKNMLNILKNINENKNNLSPTPAVEKNGNTLSIK